MCYPSYDNGGPNGYTYDPWKYYWFHDGIRKTGKGTLTLTGVSTCTHTTEVAEGSLIVSGAIANSSALTVDAGGFIGGSGRFPASVTVKDGGGFDVDVTSSAAVSLPSLTAEGDVAVRMVGANGDRRALDGHAVVTLANKPATLDVSRWSAVDENGKRVSYSFAYAPSIGTVTAHKNGLMIFLR